MSLIGFGKAIKIAREKRNITQQALAEVVGVDNSYISHIENGTLKVAPSTEIIKRLAGALGLSWGKLAIAARKIDTKALKEAAQRSTIVAHLLQRVSTQELTAGQLERINSILEEE